MRSLVFRNTSNTFRVEFKTDLSSTNTEGNFTVSEIIGLDEVEVIFGVNFRKLAYNMVAFRTFATTNNLKLDVIDPIGNTTANDTDGEDTLAITTTTLPNGNDTVAYEETVAATGGLGSYTFTITVGDLPTGLTLNASTGVISGTPTVVETQAFTMQVEDEWETTDTQALSIEIEA